MRTKTLKSLKKRVVSGILAATMVMAGVVVAPKAVDAAEAGVIYEPVGMVDFARYYNDETKIAPTKANYVFGGWYTEDNESAPIKAGDKVNAETVYAKFVPAYVLSVKGQNGAMRTSVTESSETATMRLVSSVDSLKYESVGCELMFNNEGNKVTRESTKVYETLTVDGVDKPYSASDIFGEVSEYFITWKITNIPHADFTTKVYVKPYWVTMDGTKVYGLAKYLHVIDGLKEYINVPINLCSSEDIAAGVLCVDYSSISDNYEVYDVESNTRVFSEMDYDDKGSIVKIVGNVADIKENKKASDLYACVRFKLKESGKKATGRCVFAVNSEDFCDKDENKLDKFDVWDVQY